MSYGRAGECSYFGEDVDAVEKIYFGIGSCKNKATIFISGKGYCEHHAIGKGARKRTGKRSNPRLLAEFDNYETKLPVEKEKNHGRW